MTGCTYYIKAFAFKILPKSVKKWIMLKKMLSFTIDMDVERLMAFAFSYNQSEKGLLAKLRMLTHFIEKGLTMPSPTPCFGIMRLRQIAEVVEKLGKENAEQFEMRYVSSVIEEYILFHKTRNIILPPEHMRLINKMKVVFQETTPPTTQRHYKKEEFFIAADGDFSKIAFSRHSGRNYISKPIPDKVFEDILKVASTAPSACNRQPVSVHIISSKEVINNVLNLGVGCRGFGHLAPALLIVTSDISCRDNLTERHQVALDAGFYGMNLLYALHEKGIGACVLNWDNLRKQDCQLRKVVTTLNDNETVLFLVTCGYMPDEFDVPLGLRKSTPTYYVKD